MATTRKTQIQQEVQDVVTQLQQHAKDQAERVETAIQEEARIVARHTPREWLAENMPGRFSWLLVCMAAGASMALGVAIKPMMERQTQATALYKAMQTSIPVVRALEVDMDPGKYEGKLIDVVMSVNRGGVYKSGKGVYLQELEGGMSLVIFESAFAQFTSEGGKAADIPATYIGKYVKARGTVKRFGNNGGRMSMVVYAPGLLTEIPMP